MINTLILSEYIYGYSLVNILGISNSKKTFYIHLGKQDGVLKGSKATFTTDYLSLVAQAVTVTHEYSVWRVSEKNATIPFEKNQIVTFNNALEKIWMLDPEAGQSTVKTRIRFGQKNFRIDYRNVFYLTRYFLNGLTQTISRTDSSNVTGRSGAIWVLNYAYILKSGFSLNSGIRYETETVYSPVINVPSKRLYILFGGEYHFIPFQSYSHFYLSLGIQFGIGQSKTDVAWETLAGESYIIPAFNLGAEFFLKSGYGVFIKGGLESITTNEEFKSGERQDTQEVNYKIGVGINLYI